MLESSTHTEKSILELGKYVMVPGENKENHPIFKHTNDEKHIAFNNEHGWTVSPQSLHMLYFLRNNLANLYII